MQKRYRKSSVVVTAVTVLSCLIPGVAQAVPVSFLLQESGNERDVRWKNMESERFRVYFEDKSEPTARYALKSLEAAWPYVSALLGVRLPADPPEKGLLDSRFTKIPLIINTRAETGGFANFATQNIEVQIKMGSQGSLYQHELVHRVMYEHMDPALGPAGRAFSIAMMPTWWLEGLAEYMTDSVGQLESAGTARILALKNGWLSWDSLHALYHISLGESHRGYVTAGRFFDFLMRKNTQKLPELHEDFFVKTLTPPFVNATGRMLDKYWGKNGPELYEEFKQEQRAYWEKHLEGMPDFAAVGAKTLVTSKGIPGTVVLDDVAITSSLAPKSWPSALVVTNVADGSRKRLPLGVDGSGLFDFHPAEATDGGFWTTRNESFANGTSGDQLLYVSFSGALKEIKNKNVQRILRMGVSSTDEPTEIMQIVAMGKEKAFFVGNIRGEYALYLADAHSGKIERIRKWDVPSQVRIMLSEKTRTGVATGTVCVPVLVDSDHDLTSIEKVCSDKSSSVKIPAQKLVVKDGLEKSDGSFLLVSGWHDVLAFVHWRQGEVQPLAPFPDWGDRLSFAGSKQGRLAWWSYNGTGYNLVGFTLDDYLKKANVWRQGLRPDSSWRSFPAWHAPVPPYIDVAKKLAVKPKAIPQNAYSSPDQAKMVAAVGSERPSPTEKPITSPSTSDAAEDAPYRNGHFFSYPTASVPYFGGWSLGVMSVPFMDEMERHRVEVYAQYNFSTGLPSGTVSYVNQRILDSFVVSAFSRERFNGLYYVVPSSSQPGKYTAAPYPADSESDTGYIDMLRESGGKVEVALKLRPSKAVLTGGLGLFQVLPPPKTLAPSEVRVLGAQKATLGQIEASLSTSLFEKNFYLGNPQEVGNDVLSWAGSFLAAAESDMSLGNAKDYEGKELARINYQKYSAGVGTTWSYLEHAFSLRGSVSGTTGPHTFNLREVYQPYRTYMYGASSGLNNLNYALAGDGSLFAMLNGVYAFRMSADYSFPLLSRLDKYFFIAYLDSLRGEVVAAHGGVARTEDFKNIETRDSASFAVRAGLDIKGFQIFPSLAYGQLIGRSGWGLFTELAFSQFF